MELYDFYMSLGVMVAQGSLEPLVGVQIPQAQPIRNVAQPGRALGLGPRCRRFKSCHSDQFLW